MALSLVFLSLACSLLSALVALPAERMPWLMRRGGFALLGAAGLAALGAGAAALSGPPAAAVVPLGLPWLAWHLRVDALAGVFLILLGIVVTAAAVYGPAYVREFEHGRDPLSVLGVFTGLFVAGMTAVIVADDAFFFMIAWEGMSLAGYMLVAYQHEHAANRQAAFLYLLMAQIGGLAILLAFGVLAAFSGDFTFAAMRGASLTPLWAGVAFSLALAGFGMKAGLVPLHAWLPEAHATAPSHVSALMSGVMLKVAVYGFIRVVFDLMGGPHWSWGVACLAVGGGSALFGILHAMQQQDIKRVLAYSSVENLGIVFMALGLSMVFLGTGHGAVGRLALVAALYHSLNHAVFKGLLFFNAGAVIQHGHERDLERMGGLMRRMPVTAATCLAGCMAVAALPPLNGFASEWLTFQAALQSPALESGVLRIVIPVAAAVLALSAALAAACFVRFFGVAFLGQGRGSHVRGAREAGGGMRAAQLLLAALCLLLGVLPTAVVHALEAVPRLLFGAGLPAAAAHGWLWLTPVAPQAASYGPALLLAAIAAVWGLTYWLVHRRGAAVRRAPAWGCGLGPLTPRMQYTATGFAMPVRRIFRPIWAIRETAEPEPSPRGAPAPVHYQLVVGDRLWQVLYAPAARAVWAGARRLGRVQGGNVRAYLAYSFFTLLVLLWLIT